jgi:hypothetical protein
MFGLMLGGAWLGLPWFVLNGVALGSATLRREIACAAGAFLGAAALALLAVVLVGERVVPMSAFAYLGLAPLIWKLGLGYKLATLQHRSFALWQHYGGIARRPVVIVVLALILRMKLVSSINNAFWLLVLF